MTGTPIQLRDRGGRVVFEGTQDGGGGSQPLLESAAGAGPATSLADGASGDVNWQHGSGDALLDYSAPAAPVVIAAGFYIVEATIDCNDGPQASGAMLLVLSGGGGTSNAGAPLATPGSAPYASAVVFGWFAAGDSLVATAGNFSGLGAPLAFLLVSAQVAKLA